MTRGLPPYLDVAAPERPTRLVMTPTRSQSGERCLRVRWLPKGHDGIPFRPPEDPPELVLDAHEAVELVERLAAVLLDGPHGFDGASDIAAGLRVLTRAWRAGIEGFAAHRVTAESEPLPLPAFDRSIPVFDVDERALEPAAPVELDEVIPPPPRLLPPARKVKRRAGMFVVMRTMGRPEWETPCTSTDTFPWDEQEAAAHAARANAAHDSSWADSLDEDDEEDDEHHYHGSDEAVFEADFDSDMDDYARSDEDGWFYSDDD